MNFRSWFKKNVANLVFLAFLLLILSGFFSLSFRHQQDISEAELRTLQRMPSFTISSFIDGTFQTQLEDAISDQFLFSSQIKQLVKDFENASTTKTTSLFKNSAQKYTSSESGTRDFFAETKHEGEMVAATLQTSQQDSLNIPPQSIANADDSSASDSIQMMEVPVPENAVQSSSDQDTISTSPAPVATPAVSNALAMDSTASSNAASSSPVYPQKYDYIYMEVVQNKVYKLDDSGYIIQKPASPDTYVFDIYPPEMLEKVTFPKYGYFIESSMSFDFREPAKYNAFDAVQKAIPLDGWDMLTFHNFEEYKELFYQTDHHWNYKGSYQGYCQCMHLLEGDDIVLLEPTGTHTYNTFFNGSLSRDNALKCSEEKFTVYLFNLPSYKTFVNDAEKFYGYRYLYVSDDDFPNNTYSNHYGMYYGDDRAKVVFKYDNPDAESILILSTSWSNAINELIASHYKETHVLDYRHYKSYYGKEIDAQSYMEENGLSKLLIIGDISSLGRMVK